MRSLFCFRTFFSVRPVGLASGRSHPEEHCLLSMAAVGTPSLLCASRRLAKYSRCMCRTVCRLTSGLVLGPVEGTEQKDWEVNPKHLHLVQFYFGVVLSELDYEIIPQI